MPVGYRLCNARWAPNNYENALKAGLGGGRWNSRGHPALYTAGSIALAVLEILVNSPRDLPDGYELWQIEIPGKFPKVEKMPENWRDFPHPVTVQALGDTWMSKWAVVEVPSSVIPLEFNYIL